MIAIVERITANAATAAVAHSAVDPVQVEMSITASGLSLVTEVDVLPLRFELRLKRF